MRGKGTEGTRGKDATGHADAKPGTLEDAERRT
jgi:hypothetical protein